MAGPEGPAVTSGSRHWSEASTYGTKEVASVRYPLTISNNPSPAAMTA